MTNIKVVHKFVNSAFPKMVEMEATSTIRSSFPFYPFQLTHNYNSKKCGCASKVNFHSFLIIKSPYLNFFSGFSLNDLNCVSIQNSCDISQSISREALQFTFINWTKFQINVEFENTISYELTAFTFISNFWLVKLNDEDDNH